MKNLDVVKMYVAGEENGETTHLRIEGSKLFNYNTCLVERVINSSGEVMYIVNATKYSVSTSRIQSLINASIPSSLIHHTVIDMPMGVRSL